MVGEPVSDDNADKVERADTPPPPERRRARNDQDDAPDLFSGHWPPERWPYRS